MYLSNFSLGEIKQCATSEVKVTVWSNLEVESFFLQVCNEQKDRDNIVLDKKELILG